MYKKFEYPKGWLYRRWKRRFGSFPLSIVKWKTLSLLCSDMRNNGVPRAFWSSTLDSQLLSPPDLCRGFESHGILPLEVKVGLNHSRYVIWHKGSPPTIQAGLREGKNLKYGLRSYPRGACGVPPTDQRAWRNSYRDKNPIFNTILRR